MPTKASSETYYNSDDGFKYYSIINSIDYSGMGIWDHTVEHIDPLSNKAYKRGDGRSIRDATIERDKKMLKLIQDHMPDRQVKVLELGSGRGGLSRFIAKNLLEADKLDILFAANIAEEENNYNRQMASNQNIPQNKFVVQYATFDDLRYTNESFDIVFSNEAILHSRNKVKLMEEIARMLKKDGICVISDIIEAPGVDKSKLTDVYNRLSLDSMGNHEMYDQALVNAGLTKVLKEVSSDPIINHYGMVLFSATELKREELLGPNGVNPQFLDKQIEGLHKWVECGIEGLVQQGWFIYKK